MKRKARKREIERCRQYFGAWIPRLGLQEWRIEVLYQTDKQYRKMYGEEDRSSMCVFSSWKYRGAAIYVNLGSVAKLDDDELERAIVHELVHVIVDELVKTSSADDASDHEERVVSMLAKIIVRSQYA